MDEIVQMIRYHGIEFFEFNLQNVLILSYYLESLFLIDSCDFSFYYEKTKSTIPVDI